MGSRAPAPSAAQDALSRAQAAAMYDQQRFNREQFAWMQQQAEIQNTLGREMFDRQMALADTQEARAAEQWRLYQDTTGRQTRAFSEQVDAYDTDANRQALAGGAIADVNQQLNNAQQMMSRNMAARGLNPGSAAYMAQLSDVNLSGALARSSSATMAREAARREGLQLRAQAAGLGSGAGGMAMGAMGAASGMMGSALASSGAGLNAMGQAVNTYNQGQQAAIGWGNSANNTFNSLYQQRAARASSGFGSQALAIGGTLAGAWLGGPAGAAIAGQMFGGNKGGLSGPSNAQLESMWS